MTWLDEEMRSWRLPEGGTLSERVDRMIEPLLWSRTFRGKSFTFPVGGHQYHLGGERDTSELARLASVGPDDIVLDVACFLGGPARQIAEEHGCRVVGVDIEALRLRAAARISAICGLSGKTRFVGADAVRLPFREDAFSVVWSQCSLDHNDRWLSEFRRVLAPGGRLALTFDFKGASHEPGDRRWTLEEVGARTRDLGFAVGHLEDISLRDVEFGWLDLDRRLSAREGEFLEHFGEEWVRGARAEYANEARGMREGVWGNGRMVATRL